MIEEKDRHDLIAWIKDSEDTNQYCTRNLFVDAFFALEQDPPDVDMARKRLREALPIDGYSLVEPPEFADDQEEATL